MCSCYREIMAVSNSLVYNGRLQCGSDEVATGLLQLPCYPPPQGQRDWVDGILDPQLPVLFLDTDGCGNAAESLMGGQICNKFEANLLARLIIKLRKVIGARLILLHYVIVC